MTSSAKFFHILDFQRIRPRPRQSLPRGYESSKFDKLAYAGDRLAVRALIQPKQAAATASNTVCQIGARPL
jgi:hypothetical protein